MSRKEPPVVDPLAEGEAVEARQPGADELIDMELDKYKRMMDDCAGVTDGEIVFWLHQANEKNKSLHSTYLKRYPKETPLSEIFDEARDSYGEGSYVILAKKDDVIFRKLPFSTRKPLGPEKVAVEAKIDPMDKLAVAMERLAVVDKVSRIINDARDKPPVPGVDPMVSILTVMLTGMQQQNTEMLKLMLQQRQAPAGGGNDALMEAIKLGSALAGGKLPMEEGEGGILGLLSELKPFVPQIIQMLAGKGSRPPVMNRPGAVVPKPIPAANPPGVLTPPSPPTVEDVNAILLRRVVEEIKFVLTLPVTPKLREHVIEYVAAYRPDILQQAEIVNAEMFAAYVVTLDPAFAGCEAFFVDLHKQYMSNVEDIESDLEPEGPGSLTAS